MLYYYSDEIYLASGTIRTLDDGDSAIVADSGNLITETGIVFALLGANRVSIAGTIIAGSAAIAGNASSGNNNVRIVDGGSVTSVGTSSYAIDFAGVDTSVTNAGTIDGGQGVRLLGEGSQFTNIGDLFASGEAVRLGQADNIETVNFTNSGTIVSSTASNAIALRGDGTVRMVNSGTIVAQRGTAIDFTTAFGLLTLVNTGLIQAEDRALFADRTADSVYNSGTIVGRISLLGGDDLYAGAGGQTVGVVEGGDGADTLQGGDLRDTFRGDAGDDDLNGAGGDDLLSGGIGGDVIDGGDGNDVLLGDSGADTLDGGAGRDIASYRSAFVGVVIDLADTSLSTNDAAGDSYANIEAYQGSLEDDQMLGTAANETFYGLDGSDTLNGRDGNDMLVGQDGDDVLIGGLGNDRLFGGSGRDTASYAGATGLVRVNLSLSAAQNTTSAGRDTLAQVENLIGSAFADVLTGDTFNNALDGADGADQLDGAEGDDLLTGGLGDDRLAGGSETDTVSYVAATAGITLNLSLLTAQATGGAGSDTVIDVENIIGSGFVDNLTGSTLANVLDGGVGNDQLAGGDGDDRLVGGVGNDVLTGGIGNDTADYSRADSAVRIKLATTTAQNTQGAGSDTLTGIESLIGSAFNDDLTGDNAANTLEGGVGNDSLNGGGALDIASYRGAGSAVTVDLLVETAQDTVGAGIDKLALIEGLIGSAFSDVLSGTALTNRLEGLDGNDILTGRAGNDTLIGGEGNDDLYGGDDNDTLIGGYGQNLLDGGAGIDTVSYAETDFAITVIFNDPNPYAYDLVDIQDTLVSIDAVIGSRFGDGFIAGTGIQRYNGGEGADGYSFEAGTAEADTIVGFSGAGGDGDVLYLYGYGAGATFTQLDATRWQVSDAGGTIVETITFAGGSLITPATDVVFG